VGIRGMEVDWGRPKGGSCDVDEDLEEGRDGVELDVERYILSMIFAYSCQGVEILEIDSDNMSGDQL
jgi:hypothetical protein